jgi:pSer/pThr/pTyr-binding forkhead associated (FHA) protein
MPEDRRFELVMISGPDHPEEKRLALPVGETVIVGRESTCPLRIVRDRKVSREHFSITAEKETCVIRDLGSTGGTFINGEQVLEPRSVALRDDIRAGDTRFALYESLPPGAITIPLEELEPRKEVPTFVGKDTPGFRDLSPQAIASESTDLSEEALSLAERVSSNQDYLTALGDRNLWLDAVRFAAHALPKRKAIWWGCACIRLMAGDMLAPDDQEAILLAERWVKSPNEEDRRASEKIAARLNYGTPAAWVAMGTFWAEGSLGPEHLSDPIVPKPDLTAQAIRNASVLAVVSKDPQHADRHYQTLANLAVSIAQQEQLWPQGWNSPSP